MSGNQPAPASVSSGFVDAFLDRFGKQPATPVAGPAPVPSREDLAREALAAHQQQVAQLNAALNALIEAVANVAEPALREAAEAPVAGLTQRRDAITGADAQGQAAAAIAAPGLLQEITAATQAAQAHAAASGRIAGHRTATTPLLDQAKGAVDAMLTPGALVGQLAALRSDASAAAGAAGVEAAARDREAAARQFVATATAAREQETAALGADWGANLERRSKDVAAALAKAGENRGKLEAVLGFAESAAEKGNFVAAMKALAEFDKMAAALPAAAEPGQEKTKAGVAAVDDQTAITAELAKAQGLAEKDLKAVIDAAGAFGANPAAPAAWKVETDRIGATLKLDRSAGLVAIKAAVTAAQAAITAQMKVVTDLTAARTAWTADWAAYEKQRDSLTAHSAAASDPVLAQFTALKLAAQAAQAKTNTCDFAGAKADLAVQTAKFPALMKLADGSAQYTLLLAKREPTVPALATATDPITAINTAITAANTCVTEAKAAKLLGKFPEAIAALNKIPDIVLSIDVIRKQAAKYEEYRASYQSWYAHWNGLEAKYKNHFQPELAALQPVLSKAAAAAAANNFPKAATIIIDVGSVHTEGTKLQPLVYDYVPKQEHFDTEFEKVKAYSGTSNLGIEDFWQKITKDKALVDAFVAKRQYAAANKVLDALPQPDFSAQIAVAEEYKTYKTAKDAAIIKINEIRALNTTGTATQELSGVDKYLAAATAQETAKKFAEAQKAVDEALARAQTAKKLLETEKAVTDLKPAAGADAAALQARANAYPAMKAKAAPAPVDPAFTALVATADAAHQEALAKLGEPVNLVAAAAALDRADSILKDAMVKIARKPAYDASLLKVENLLKDNLQVINVDPNKCIDPEIEKVKQAIAGAKEKAKSPDFKFGEAEVQLAEAAILCGRAAEKVAAFTSLAPDRKIIKDLITHISVATYQPALQREKERLEKIQTDIDKLLAAFTFAAATKMAKDGAALKAPFEQLCTDYTAVKASETSTYADAAAIAGKPVCKIETDKQAALKPQIDKMINEDHAFAAASKLLEQYGWETYYGNAYLADFTTFEAARKVEMDLWTTLKIREHPDLVKITAEIDGVFAKLDALAVARSFKQTDAELKPLHARLLELKKQMDEYAPVVAARATAKPLVDGVVKHAGAKAITPLVELIQAKNAEAEEMVKRGAFTQAATLLNELVAQCAAAKSAADSFTPFEALGSGAADPAKEALEAAIAKIEVKIAALQSAPGEQQLPGKVIEAQTALDVAKTALARGTAGVADLIKTASAACGAAEIHTQQYAQIKAQQDAALKLVDDFRAGGHAAKAFVDTRMAENRKVMGTALQVMTGTGAAAASKVLVDASTTFRGDVALADQRVAYDTLRKTLVPEAGPSVLKTYQDSPNRYAATDDMNVLEAKLAEAAKFADAAQPDFAKAMAALKEADAASTAAKVAITMEGNAAAPKKEDLEKILSQPKGDEKLDALIARLDPAARRDCVAVAMEARFGCAVKFSKGGAADASNDNFGPDAQRYYKNLKKLPPKHALKNDGLLTIEDFRDATGTAGAGGSSTYLAASKTVAMRDGPATTSSGVGMGEAYAMGDAIPDNCKPANDDAVQRFDWNALHEVGHAVDDRYHVMVSHKGDAAYGGWTEYVRDVRAVAEKLVAEFDYDLAYTQAKLNKETNPPLPEPKAGVEPDDWERRRQKVDAWVEMASSGNNPWETNSVAQALKLKSGEIIHESQAGMWYGYLASERSKGLTGYQFRSPLEWFSELYAGFHSGKLKESHPSYNWLKGLGAA